MSHMVSVALMLLLFQQYLQGCIFLFYLRHE